MNEFNYYFNAKPDVESSCRVIVHEHEESANISYPSFIITEPNIARELARALIDAAHKMELINHGF